MYGKIGLVTKGHDVDALSGISTEDLASEVRRREKAELDAFIKSAPRMTEEALKAVVDNEDCEFERIYEYTNDTHCKGCAAEAEIRRREREAYQLAKLVPGAIPPDCTSVRSGTVNELRTNDVLERHLYPGSDVHDHVRVSAVEIGESVVVTLQRTNDPDSEFFEVEYPYSTYIRAIWRKR